MPVQPGSKQTFEVLNGLRGMAAIAVVCMHFSFYMASIHPANVAPAVDFFFVLSGFVIGYAYEPRLRAEMTVGAFAVARTIRFYPVYLIGLLLGIVVTSIYGPAVRASTFGSQLAFNLFMLPSPFVFDPSNPVLFPFDFTFWSLSFELFANLVYAALLPRLSNRLLAVVIGIGFLGLVASGLIAGSLDNGTLRTTFFGGFARVTYSFFAGIALYRLWRRRPTRISVHPGLLFALLILPLLLKPGAPFGWLYELAVVALWMPAMVWLGSGARASGRWLPISITLGAMSYPLYVIQAPVWIAFRAASGWRDHTVLQSYGPWSGIVMIVVLAALSWGLDKFVDYPVRRRLSAALLRQPTRAADPDLYSQPRPNPSVCASGTGPV